MSARTGASGPSLVELIYELLDAHEDTLLLARDLDGGAEWDRHLQYLQALQRAGRETLARHGEVVA